MKTFPLTANGKLDEAKLREVCMVKLSLFLNEALLAKKTRRLMAKNAENKR